MRHMASCPAKYNLLELLHHNPLILASFIIYLSEVIVSVGTNFINRVFFTMPSQGNIDAARQCSDATRAATIG